MREGTRCYKSVQYSKIEDCVFTTVSMSKLGNSSHNRSQTYFLLLLHKILRRNGLVKKLDHYRDY